MSTENHWKTFIGQKVSKLSWTLKRNGDLNPNEFLTASWDDARNAVSQWKIPDELAEEGNNPEPYMTNQVFLNGSITDLALLDFEVNYVFWTRTAWSFETSTVSQSVCPKSSHTSYH